MLKSVRFSLIGFGLASLGMLAACQSSGSVPAATPVATLPARPTAIVALGRIVPEGDVIKLSVPNALERDKVDSARRDRETAHAALVQRQAELQQSQTTLAAQIREAEANLKALRQVLPVDVAIAEAELQRALVELEQRRADLEDTEVRAPIPGQILRINTRVGEQVNTQQGMAQIHSPAPEP